MEEQPKCFWHELYNDRNSTTGQDMRSDQCKPGIKCETCNGWDHDCDNRINTNSPNKS